VPTVEISYFEINGERSLFSIHYLANPLHLKLQETIFILMILNTIVTQFLGIIL